MRDVDGLPMRKLGSQSGAYNLQNPSVQFNQVNQPFNPIGANFDEAKEISKKIIDTNTVLKVDSTIFGENLTLAQLNRYNEQINKLSQEYNLSPHLDDKSQISLQFFSSKKAYGFVQYDSRKLYKVNFGDNYDKVNRITERVSVNQFGTTKFAPKSKVDPSNVEISTLTHEFAHVISVENKAIFSQYPQMARFWKEITSLKTKYKKEINRLGKEGDLVGLNNTYLGDYASTNKNEFMAEAFTEYKLSSNPSKYAIEVGRLIDKYFKK
jgi:hypothetical protein